MKNPWNNGFVSGALIASACAGFSTTPILALVFILVAVLVIMYGAK